MEQKTPTVDYFRFFGKEKLWPWNNASVGQQIPTDFDGDNEDGR